MSLSFREQAAIALFAAPVRLDNGHQFGMTETAAVGGAQILADRFCKENGHDPWPVVPWDQRTRRQGPEALKTDEQFCRRCGKKINPDAGEP